MTWLTGWYRRKPKLVRGSTAGAQIDYQLKLTIYKGSGTDTDNIIYLGTYVNDDFSDLRFTSSDETTLLPYWIENYISGVSAIVWIKIDSIPADPLSKTIYIYYDNLVATTVSNGAATFELFEDFETYTLGQTLIGQNGWFNGYGTNNQYVLAQNDRVRHGNQSLRIYSVSASRQDAEKNVNFTTDVAIEWDMQTTKPTSSRYAWTYTFWLSPSGTITNIFFDRQYDGYGAYISCIQQRGLQTYTPDTWYKIRLVIKFTTKKIDIYIDNVLRASNLNFYDIGATGLSKMGFDVYTEPVYGPYDNYGWFDTVRYSKYVSPEPTFSATSPEQIYTANLTVSSTPTGAEIWINNIDQGVTTTGWFILNPGIYTVMLTKPGYQDYIQIITLSSNQNAIVHGNLISTTGNLDVSSTPSGAEIFLAPTGSPLVDQWIMTPSTISLSPGTYDYKLTRIDYYDATGSFTIISGLTTILNIILTPLPCTVSPKYSGNIITMNATPVQGAAPYTIQFRKSPAQSMGNDETAATEVISDIRIPGGNNVSGVAEGTTIIRVYTLDSADIEGATTKSGDTGPSILFASEITDSCTPSQSCIKYCKIFVGCTVPVCDFIVI